MVGYYSSDVRFTVDFDVVASLEYIDAIEAFDNTQVVQGVSHKALYFGANSLADGEVFGGDDKVVDLAED